MSIFNRIRDQYQRLSRAMDDRKLISLPEAAKAMNVKQNKVDHSLVIMTRRGYFGACQPYVDEQLNMVILDNVYSTYAKVKCTLEKLGNELIQAKNAPRKLTEKREKEHGKKTSGIGDFFRDFAGNLLNGESAKESLLYATSSLISPHHGYETGCPVSTQEMEEILAEMLTDAREMNQLMLNYPNFAYQQENADWLNKAFLAVQSWENALEACFVSRTKSHTMIQVERQLREEYRPELRRRVELLLKLAGAGITAPEDDSLANEIAACCASLQKNREKMRSTVMREATDETITVLCEIRDHLNADSVLSCGTSLRSLRASYLPMVQTLTEKYVQYEARGMSGSDIRSAMEETENVMKNVVPSALRRLRDELNSGTAIDLETQATALKQKLEMDGLLSNASGVNAH